MAQSYSRSAFERLQDHYNETDCVCPACGYEDDDGGWVCETDGANARYSRKCPSCDAVQEHTVTFTK